MTDAEAADPRRVEAERLYMEAVELEEDGRTAEAVELYRRVERMGVLCAKLNLATALTDLGGRQRQEGMRRLGRLARGGEWAAAWNLAMTHRRAGDRRWYLYWLRAAAGLGEEDAGLILAEIERRIADGRSWTMIWQIEIDASDVVWRLSEFRAGRITAATLAGWADDAVSLRSTLALEPTRRRELAVILRELADPARRLTRQRASELIFRLG